MIAGGHPPGAVRHLARGAPGWPTLLDHLDPRPSELWICGPLPLGAPAVAVVGARDATVGGLEIARRLGADLAAAGVPVISGMALGIDAAAHSGALDGGGATVAVLGCGIDICYPRRHRELRDRIAATGAVLTEEPPGTPPAGWRFPRRNRIIAALAAAVVVVEASPRSGALSTARHALDLGREVFAVPGSLLSERSAGANALLRDGAAPLTEAADLTAVPALTAAIERARARFRLASTGFPPARRSNSGETGSRHDATLQPELAAVFRTLGHDPVHPDALAHRLQLTPPALATRLAELELAGLVRTVDGGLLVRTPGIDMRPKLGTTPEGPPGTLPDPLL